MKDKKYKFKDDQYEVKYPRVSKIKVKTNREIGELFHTDGYAPIYTIKY